MKTIVISAIPYVKSGLGLFPPIGSLSIASTLSYNGYDVCFIDVSTNHNWEQELKNTLKSDTISAVALASYTSNSIKTALQIVDVVRKYNKQIPIIWGGYHASATWQSILEENLAEIAVKSAGEIPILKIIHQLHEHSDISNCDLSEISNIAYIKDNRIVANPLRIELDEALVPPLNYHMIDIKKYDSMDCGRVFAYSSHGCPSRCIFCSEASHTGGLWNGFSAERVVQDIQYYIKEFNASRIDYVEANFAADVNRVIAVCNLLLEKNLHVHISANMRVKDILKLSKKTDLKLLRDAGFDELFIGVESGSDRILEYLHKGCTCEEIYQACKFVNSAGIGAKVSFMSDLPIETIEDSKATMQLSRRLCQFSNIRQVHHIFFPFPNTPIFNSLFGNGQAIKQCDWIDFTQNTTFGGSSFYTGHRAIRSHIQAEVSRLKEEYPSIFCDQSPLKVD